MEIINTGFSDATGIEIETSMILKIVQKGHNLYYFVNINENGTLYLQSFVVNSEIPFTLPIEYTNECEAVRKTDGSVLYVNDLGFPDLPAIATCEGIPQVEFVKYTGGETKMHIKYKK